jgi:hypothetical protein
MQQSQINSVHPSTKFDHSQAVLFHHAHAIICLTGAQIVSAGRHLSKCMQHVALFTSERGTATGASAEWSALPILGAVRRSQAANPWQSFVSLFSKALRTFPDRPKVHVASVRVRALFYFNPIFASRSTDLRPRVTVESTTSRAAI